MKKGISGYTLCRNALKGDYCVELAIQSLLPVCDEVVVADADSDDGTKEMLTDLTKKHPKLRVVHQEWTQPVNDPKWFVRWINSVRPHLEYDHQMMLDADEVLCETAYPLIREYAGTEIPLWFSRLNFWRDGKTLIGHGETCGHEVVRFGPTRYFMPSDEPYGTEAHPGPEPPIRRKAVKVHPLPKIFHYGFLRPLSGMVEKSKVNLIGFFGGFDTRLSMAMMHPDRPWQDFLIHKKPFLTYDGRHPNHCKPWLRKRGAL